MNYKEAVERQILGEMDELTRRKELWREIFTAYEKGGEDMIKSVLTTYMNKMAQEFEKLLTELRKKL